MIFQYTLWLRLIEQVSLDLEVSLETKDKDQVGTILIPLISLTYVIGVSDPDPTLETVLKKLRELNLHSKTSLPFHNPCN